jgi:hypothetical protein
LSQEVEYRLRVSIGSERKNRGTHVRALGEAVMLVAQCIERATEKPWNEDAFTGEALRCGIEFLISHFAPRGPQVTPKSIEEAAAKRAGERYRSPAGVGGAETGRVISWIESWSFRTLDEITGSAIPGLHIPDEWYVHEGLLRDLGSGLERARAWEKRR